MRWGPAEYQLNSLHEDLRNLLAVAGATYSGEKKVKFPKALPKPDDVLRERERQRRAAIEYEQAFEARIQMMIEAGVLPPPP